jgi:hypothetical protein
MTTVPAHMQALYMLVEQRGGIRSITTFGIAETIQYIVSSKTPTGTIIRN